MTVVPQSFIGTKQAETAVAEREDDLDCVIKRSK
jgi:hypothetical protein